MIEKYNVLEHIRKRPGMYIGSLDHSGFNELIYYLIQDFIKKEVHEITFILKENNRLIIIGFNPIASHFIQDAIKNINDYKDKHFYLSLSSLIALSDSLTIETNQIILQSNKGIFEIIESINDDDKIKIDFTPDKDIFKDLILSYQNLNNLLKRFSFLNNKIKIRSIDESTDELQINIFYYPKGLLEIIDFELKKKFQYHSPVFKLNFQKNTTFSYSLALAFIDSCWIKPDIKVYANYKETILGGSLLNGIFQGFKKFLKEEFLNKNLKVNITNTKLKKHLLLYASVTGDLSYLGATRWKLGTPKVQSEIKEFVYQELRSYFIDKEDKITDILNILQDTD